MTGNGHKREAPPNSVAPSDREEWSRWLRRHHRRSSGLWLVRRKKASGGSLTYDEIVDEALRFGWIDSKPNKLDAERSLLWLAPRKPGTNWSRNNKRRIARLVRQGLMAPAGLAKVAAAKRDGSWNALDEVETLEVPADLRAALDRYPHAPGNFDAFPRSTRRAILEWIAGAKRAETRTTRIETTARLAERNVRANQWRQPKGAGARP